MNVQTVKLCLPTGSQEGVTAKISQITADKPFQMFHIRQNVKMKKHIHGFPVFNEMLCLHLTHWRKNRGHTGEKGPHWRRKRGLTVNKRTHWRKQMTH